MIKLYRYSILWLLCAVSWQVTAQNLAGSRQSSYYTFIYKVSDKEARNIYRDEYPDIGKDYFHSFVDFFPTDSSYHKKLPVGHYIFAKSVSEKMAFTIHSVNNLTMHILDNKRDLTMVFYDTTGREVHGDLVVHVKGRNVPFNLKAKAFVLKRSNKRGLVRASFQGHTSYFEIDRRYNNTFFVRTGKKILSTFPVNHITSPGFYLYQNVRNIFNHSRPHPPGIYYRVKKIFTKHKTWSGYMAFNKPIYRPGDTVKLKAFVTTPKGKPVDKDVTVKLYSYGGQYRDLTLGKANRYRKGGYTFEFILHDSLKLRLDQRLSVSLQHKPFKTLMTDNIKYEDYELKQNNYAIRSEAKGPDQPATLYLKGTDSNELPLYDVRAEILITPGTVRQFFHKKVFIPDTLWRHTVNLEPIGETRVVLPDSIFPPVDMAYKAQVAFLNTENERHVKSADLNFNKRPFPVSFDLANDSINVCALPGYEASVKEVRIEAMDDEGNRCHTASIELPHRSPVIAAAEHYKIFWNGQSKTYEMSGFNDGISTSAWRTYDSLFVEIVNPRNLLIRYQLFQGNQLIERNTGTNIHLKRKSNPSAGYAIAMQYIWGGRGMEKNYDIPFNKNDLTVDIHSPLQVYPGQEAAFTIEVKDAAEKPVADADITAYAITKKFKLQKTPHVPAFAKSKKGRKVFNEFHEEDLETFHSRFMDWPYWRRVLGLDSITFYKFLYPENGCFMYYTPAKDSITQFAPFVVESGRILPVRVIYVDGIPVYYSGTETVRPYSFRGKPGEHTVKLRLATKEIVLEHVLFNAGDKLILSVDLGKELSYVSVYDRPAAFTADEKKILYRYFMVVNGHNRAPAYLYQGNNYYLLAQNRYRYNALAGPFHPGRARVVEKDRFDLRFDFEPNHAYEFREGLIKMRYTDMRQKLSLGSRYQQVRPQFEDHVLTREKIEAYWKDLERKEALSFKKYPATTAPQNGGKLRLAENHSSADTLLRAVFMINPDVPEQYYIFPATGTDYGPLQPGNYQAVLIYSNEKYIRNDSISIKPHGLTFYDLKNYIVHPPDSFSRAVIQTIKGWATATSYVQNAKEYEMQHIRREYYATSSEQNPYTHLVTGRIVDAEGNPLPGVNVIIRGTRFGTVTDMNGHYNIHCPAEGTLVFSFIGYITESVDYDNRHVIDMTMDADVQSLQEIVVVGYGVQRRSTMTAAMSVVTTNLQGRIAGVSVLPDSLQIRIRGANAMTPGAAPLVLIDGVPKKLEDIDPALITAYEVLKGASATALYGSRAAGGVILISTKPGMTAEKLRQDPPSLPAVLPLEGSMPGSTLRKNFRDYAFWQPALRTDEHGRVSFKATFPDDVTGWEMYALGMASKKRTGQGSAAIRSFKPLLAQLALPNFLLQGDTTLAIGKVTNYTPDTVSVTRALAIGTQNIFSKEARMANSQIDSIFLTTAHTDSLAVKYTIQYNDYKDGELRKIPVYPLGAKEATGTFAALPGDTTFTLTFDRPLGKVKLYAQADLLDVLAGEIHYLRSYPYECNEQLASKLRGLLAEKKMQEFRKKTFTGDREVEKIIRKLVKNQHPDGSWGWWNVSRGDVWLTVHVGSALERAKAEKYTVRYDRESMIAHIAGLLAETKDAERLRCLIFLAGLGEPIDARAEAGAVMRRKNATNYEKLLAQKLLSEAGAKPDLAWIDSIKRTTLKGNLCWGEERDHLLNNDAMNTLLAYQIRERSNPDDPSLLKIRNFFLEKRQRHWRNTYESSLILETILPGLLRSQQSEVKTGLRLSGGINRVVDAFPFEAEIDPGQSVTIYKTGTAPVYFAAYQEVWNPTPERVDKEFNIRTSFEGQGKRLKAGKPVTLKVDIEVKKDAEYVMIQVPVPAGCSYQSKNPGYGQGEVHREHYKHQTNIYATTLRRGRYTYRIELVPRFKGRYTLNPATVEWMYFPVIFGREETKKLAID